MTEESLHSTGRERASLLPGGERLARILLFINPALFAGNIIVARATADSLPPVALAFWRWTAALILLLLFVGPAVWRDRADILAEWRELLPLGALGMGVCGAFVYIGADTTTATNIGLIYSGAPVAIILLDHLLYGARMIKRQWLGVAFALAGMLLIVFRGSLETLLSLALTPGDFWIIGAASGWALYSILLKHRPTKLSPNVRFAAIMLAGVLVLAPFHLWESLFIEAPEVSAKSLAAVAFLALVPSLAAYGSYAYMQRHLGASATGLILYLMPLYGAGLAFLLLGERLQTYHLAGALLVLPGIWLATRKRR